MGHRRSRLKSGCQLRMPSASTRISCTCAELPSSRSCRSRRMPLVIASAIISAATPAATPGNGDSGDYAHHGLPPLGFQVPRRQKQLESHQVVPCSRHTSPGR